MLFPPTAASYLRNNLMAEIQINWVKLARDIPVQVHGLISNAASQRFQSKAREQFSSEAVKAVFDRAGLTASERLVIERLYPARGPIPDRKKVVKELRIGPIRLQDFRRSAFNKLRYALTVKCNREQSRQPKS